MLYATVSQFIKKELKQKSMKLKTVNQWKISKKSKTASLKRSITLRTSSQAN